MPTLPSVINAMKEASAPAPPSKQPQQQTQRKPSNVQSDRRRSSYDDKVFDGITENRRISFGQRSSSGALDDAAKQREKNRFGKITLSARQKTDIASAFHAFDVEGTGYMSLVDLRVVLKALGFDARQEEIKKLLEENDIGITERLCYSDFLRIIEHKLGENDTKEELLKTFVLFDKDDSGMISFENLKEVVQELEEDLNDEEIKEMIEEADLDEDGLVNEEEFLKILKKESLY